MQTYSYVDRISGSGGGGVPISVAQLDEYAHGARPALPSSGLRFFCRRYAGYLLAVSVDAAGFEQIYELENATKVRVVVAAGAPAFEGCASLSVAGTYSIINPTAGGVRNGLVRAQLRGTGLNAGAGWGTGTVANPSLNGPLTRREGFLVEIPFSYASMAQGMTSVVGVHGSFFSGEPSSFFNTFFVGFDTTDLVATGLILIRRGPSGAAVRVTIPGFTRNANNLYRCYVGAVRGDLTQMFITLVDVTAGVTYSASFNTTLPDPDVGLTMQAASNVGTSGVVADFHWQTSIAYIPY